MNENDGSVGSIYPAITIGVVTHDKRVQAFRKLLWSLKPAISSYQGECELLIGNNGGEKAHETVQNALLEAEIAKTCACRVLDSPENNISVGRNIVVDNAQFELLAFVDDDEYVTASWLEELVRTLQMYQCDVVTGPIEAIYPENTIFWVRDIDVHNNEGKSTGDRLQFACSGNVIMKLASIGENRFDLQYGRTGGGDTEFFMRLSLGGADIRWCDEARIFEDISADRSSWKYALRRCMYQGANYRRVLTTLGLVKSQALMSIRAILVFLLSIVVSVSLLAIRHRSAGNWLKRAFSNLGKVSAPVGFLYP